MPSTPTPVKLADVLPDDALGRLSRQTVYFGHQSVGSNILDGIRDLASEDPRLALDIRETGDLSAATTPTFAHARIGRNGQPLSKVEAFANAFRHRGASVVDIALMKFCYTDFSERADVPEVFRSYAATLAALRQEAPATTFVHVTVPITAPVNPVLAFLKSAVKRALGRRGYESKRAIADFNELIATTYRGREPVFDLAAIESTHADGTRVWRREGGTAVYSLAPEFTSDGAHLNERGRRVVALELLRFLATLPGEVPAR